MQIGEEKQWKIWTCHLFSCCSRQYFKPPTPKQLPLWHTHPTHREIPEGSLPTWSTQALVFSSASTKEQVQVSPESELQVMTSRTLPMGYYQGGRNWKGYGCAWRPNETSHKARRADKLTYCYPKCTALLPSLFRKGPEVALGRQCLVQKNYLTMLFPISKFTGYPYLPAFLPINVVVQVQSQQIVSQ